MDEIREVLNLVWMAAEQRTVAYIVLYFVWSLILFLGFAICLIYARKSYLAQIAKEDEYYRNYWPCGILYSCAGTFGALAVITLMSGLGDMMSMGYVTLANISSLVHYIMK